MVHGDTKLKYIFVPIDFKTEGQGCQNILPSRVAKTILPSRVAKTFLPSRVAKTILPRRVAKSLQNLVLFAQLDLYFLPHVKDRAVAAGAENLFVK